MSVQKLYILNIPNLYDIIAEINDDLNFDVTNFRKKEEILNKNDNQRDLLVNTLILINKKDYAEIKNKFNEDNLHCISKTPFKISNLIDQLNVKIIQQKYKSQSNIKIKNYNLDLNSRLLKNEKEKIKLTEREIDTILFLKNESKPCKVEILQKKVWKYGEDLETHTVETHIYRLRKKIKNKFNDDDFIISKENGYKINE